MTRPQHLHHDPSILIDDDQEHVSARGVPNIVGHINRLECMGNQLKKVEMVHTPVPDIPRSANTTFCAVAASEPLRGHHKGLSNLAGQNNCFLNATLQALWHLDTFRSAIRGVEAEADVFEISIEDMITVVNSLFVQYEFSEGSTIPATEIRSRLVSIDPQKFAQDSLADASEALYCILSQIHNDSCVKSSHRDALPENDDCSPKCLAHSIFGGVFVEQYSCSACAASSEPQIMNRLLHYIYADEICSQVKEYSTPPSFERVLSYCLRPVAHACPSNSSRLACRGEGRACLSCLEPPKVLAFCVTWAEDSITSDKLFDFLGAIAVDISASKVFPFGNVADSRFIGPTHSLSGIVCFYGKHYVCFFRDDPSSELFILFDDSRMRVVGDWNLVHRECLRSRYQPVLLLYQLKPAFCPTDTFSTEGDASLRDLHWSDSSPPTILDPDDKGSGSTIQHLATDADCGYNALSSPMITTEGKHHVVFSSDSDEKKQCSPFEYGGSGSIHESLTRSPSIKLSRDSFNRNLKLYKVILSFEPAGRNDATGLCVQKDVDGHLVVIDFLKRSDGQPLPAERTGKISLMDRIVAVNGISVEKWSIDKFLKYMDSVKEFPFITIQFEAKVWS